MKFLTAAICLSLLAPPSFAQENKGPSPAQKKQQERMMECNALASGTQGDARKKFMSDCLKGDQPSAAQKKQQDRMKDCNRKASDKGMKGDDRQKFMSSCLRG
jgi:hypothetical protein